jgi:hypothetical protein
VRTSSAIVVALVLGAAASLAAAIDIPIPKVMSDAPREDGRWKMEPVQMPGVDKAALAAAGSGVTVCTSAAKAMSNDQPGTPKNDCRFRLLEDGTTRAVMETTCGSHTQRTTITQLAPRSYEMSVQRMDRPNDVPMIARMSYVGTCSASDSVIGYGKDSPACQKMQAQKARLDPAKACAGAGAQRAQCEQMVQQQRARAEAMCK